MPETYAFNESLEDNNQNTLAKISRQIFEMDANSCVFLTGHLKQYMSESFDAAGNFNYNRLGQLEKLVNTIYYGPYQKEKERACEQKNKYVSPIEDKKFFQLLYEKENAVGSIDFERLDELTWRTSEVGRWAYDSTHRAFPSWLLRYMPLEKPKVASIKYDKPYGEKITTVRAVICGIDAVIKLWRRRHESGIVYRIMLSFNSKADANRFAYILNKKQQDNARAEEKIRLGEMGAWGYISFPQN